MWIEEESWILACDDLLTFSVASSILIIIGKMKKKKVTAWFSVNAYSCKYTCV